MLPLLSTQIIDEGNKPRLYDPAELLNTLLQVRTSYRAYVEILAT